jgi:hypothetical protein
VVCLSQSGQQHAFRGSKREVAAQLWDVLAAAGPSTSSAGTAG